MSSIIRVKGSFRRIEQPSVCRVESIMIAGRSIDRASCGEANRPLDPNFVAKTTPTMIDPAFHWQQQPA